jgi:lipopolysaccharide transport system ATP-binding protein
LVTSAAAGSDSGLDEGLALSVEQISKTYSGVHESRYRPAVSIYARLRERRGGAAGTRPSGRPGPGDDAEEEDDEDLDETDSDELFGEELGAALEDVTFDVRRGEAVGIIGSPESSARTVGRILCGMTAPTSGRMLVRGRVAPSVELAIALTRRETTAPAVARRLAGLAGPRRRDRGAFVRSALVLALGEHSSEVTAAQPPKEILRRVAVAAAFDPTANLLVVDMLPDYGDPDLPRRCRERLEERLAGGAAAIVTSGDLDLVSALCSRVVLLDEGRVTAFGPTERVLRGLSASAQTDAGAGPRPSPSRKRRLAAFDEHAALMLVELEDGEGRPRESIRTDEEIVLRLPFETATTATVMVVVRFVGDAAHTFTETAELHEGAYAATLRLSPGTLAPGTYEIDAGLVLEHDGLRTKVGRRPAARLGVEGDDQTLALGAAPGSLPSAPGVGRSGEAEWTLESVAP